MTDLDLLHYAPGSRRMEMLKLASLEGLAGRAAIRRQRETRGRKNKEGRYVDAMMVSSSMYMFSL